MLIEIMGYVYRMSRKNWKRYCKQMVYAPNMAGSIEDHGGKCLGQVKGGVTDWTSDEYEEELERLKQVKRSKR